VFPVSDTLKIAATAAIDDADRPGAEPDVGEYAGLFTRTTDLMPAIRQHLASELHGIVRPERWAAVKT
jgi:hypothetical protein